MGAPLPSQALDPSKKLSQYVQRHWKIENGLPTNSLYAITQTQEGYIWIGTGVGLFRFDGIQFRGFNPPGISVIKSGVIRTLYEDRSGVLWIGSLGDGVIRYQNGQFDQFTTQNGLASNSITHFVEDRDAAIWITTSTGGVSRFHNGQFKHYNAKNGLLSDVISSIEVDDKNRVWVGTSKGLNVIEADRKTIKSYTTADGLPHGDIFALLITKNGKLWVGTRAGLCLKDGTSFETFYDHWNKPVKALLEDRHGNLWIGLDMNGGLYRRHGNRLTKFRSNEGVSNFFVKDIFEDNKGNLWIAMLSRGLFFLADGKIVTHSVQEGLHDKVVFGLFEDSNNRVWVGTGKGFQRYEKGSIESSVDEIATTEELGLTMIETRAGEIWLGYFGKGVTRLINGEFDHLGKEDGITDERIRCLFEDSKGNVWIGTNVGGLFKYKKNLIRHYSTTDGLISGLVSVIREDKRGRLWVGSYSGLSVLEGNHFKTFTKKDGLANETIMDIYIDEKQTIWIGSHGGLIVYRNNRFSVIANRDGLLNDTVYSVLEDNRNNIWIGTNKGIARMSKQSLLDYVNGEVKSFSSQKYGREDGLKSIECNGGFQNTGIKTSDGRLWFSTDNGVSIVDPSLFVKKDVAPKVIIEEVLVDGKPIKKMTEIPPKVERVEFHYVGLDYAAPKQVRYQYRLSGYDSDWVDVTRNRVVQYTNLMPGQYEFNLKACNKDGIWSKKVASFSFSKKPQFTQTPLFYILVGFVALLIILALYSIRVRQIEQKQKNAEMFARMLEQKVDDRTLELKKVNQKLGIAKEIAENASKTKNQFLANISHEIRTPLNAILGFSELIMTEKPAHKINNYAGLILAESENLLDLINQLLDIYKIESGKLELELNPFDLEHLMETINSSMCVRARNCNLSYRSTIEENTAIRLIGDPMRLRQILVNLINNAIKFTDKGSVTISCKQIHDTKDMAKLHFSIEDTGIGIPQEKHALIFESFAQADGSTTRKYGGTGLGTTISRQLVELMDGEIGLESEEGKGSTFWFTVEIKKRNLATLDEGEQDKLKIKNDLTIPVPVDKNKIKQKGNILLVEDYPTNREIATTYLNNNGHTVMVAKNGKKAVTLTKENSFNIILMDIQMPIMDGYTATELIRSGKSQNADIPIIAMTANVYEKDRIKCIQAGMNDVITKPFRREPFLKTVERWIASSNVHLKTEAEIFLNTEVENIHKNENENVPINFEQVVNEFEGDKGFLIEVARRFLEDVDEQVLVLKNALKKRDAETIQKEAHKIKGGAANLIAKPMEEAAKQLELQAKSGNFEDSTSSLDRFEEELKRLKDYFFHLM